MAAASLAALLAGGCSALPSPGDRAYQNGDLARAEREYRRQLDGARPGPRRERALLRLAVIYSRAGSERYDPERAAEYLQRLVDHGGGGDSAHAALLLGLLQRVAAVESALDAQRRRAASLADELARVAARAAGGAGAGDERARGLALEVAELRREIERLRHDLAEREGELERLKAIDLGAPPP